MRKTEFLCIFFIYLTSQTFDVLMSYKTKLQKFQNYEIPSLNTPEKNSRKEFWYEF